jgi:hypothetical protein
MKAHKKLKLSVREKKSKKEETTHKTLTLTTELHERQFARGEGRTRDQGLTSCPALPQVRTLTTQFLCYIKLLL